MNYTWQRREDPFVIQQKSTDWMVVLTMVMKAPLVLLLFLVSIVESIMTTEAWSTRLQTVFPTMTSYEITETIVQPNALGYKVKLQHNKQAQGDSHAQPDFVFVKTVTASNYVPKRTDWADLRRTLLYARTEARFYSMLPVLQERGFDAAPAVYLSWYDLSPWITEQERSIDPAGAAIDKDALENTDAKGCLIIMECVSEETHFQESPLTISQAKQCLAAAAHLHAAAWQDEALLQRASVELSRASFHLETRNPKELAGMEASWEHFVSNFKDDMVKAGVWNESVKDLGTRVKAMAHYISTELSPQPTDPFATVIHGDYKAMNVLLAKPESGAKAVLVDYASIGIGLGMSDVAMHLHHAVLPEDLDNGGEQELVDYYYQTLQASLPDHDYPKNVALRHYRLGVVDYFRFFLGRMWKTATHETMEQKKDNKNIALINRSVSSACAFVGRVDTYLTEIEKEYAASKQQEL